MVSTLRGHVTFMHHYIQEAFAVIHKATLHVIKEERDRDVRRHVLVASGVQLAQRGVVEVVDCRTAVEL